MSGFPAGDHEAVFSHLRWPRALYAVCCQCQIPSSKNAAPGGGDWQDQPQSSVTVQGTAASSAPDQTTTKPPAAASTAVFDPHRA